MGEGLPANARLPPEILLVAVKGLIALREMELNEAHRLTFGPRDSQCSSALACPFLIPAHPAAVAISQRVFDHMTGSSQLGTRVLQAPELYEDRGGRLQCVEPCICGDCLEELTSGHAALRKKAWAALPDVFGLKG